MMHCKELGDIKIVNNSQYIQQSVFINDNIYKRMTSPL